MKQRGFAFLALLGSPWVWLAIGAALLSFTGWQLWGSWQREARVRGEYSAFVDGTRRAGEAKVAENAKIVKSHQEALREAKKRFATDLARRDADLARLRAAPPTDPGGRPLSTLAVCPGGVDAPPEERLPAVSLADYHALEERAYDDARRLLALQDWVRATNHPVE